MIKKKKRSIITGSVILIIALALILFVPYEKEESCWICSRTGEVSCYTLYYAEALSGQKVYNHDCGLCENGNIDCSACENGRRTERKTNFKRWFD